MSSVRPASDDPDRATEIGGALSTADFGWLAKSTLGLVFVVAAAAVAIGRALLIRADLVNGGPLDLAASEALFAAAATLAILLPAALLWRAPGATRTHRLLLGGLSIGALVEVVRLASIVVPASVDQPVSESTLGILTWLLRPAGSLLVGLGLLRLRSDRAGRRGLLVGLVVLYLGLAWLPIVLALEANQVVVATWLSLLSGAVVPTAAAFAGWVAVDAWLDHGPDARFWGLLAIALPLYVVGALFSGLVAPSIAVAMPFGVDPLNHLASLDAAVGAIVTLAAVGCAFVAFSRWTPGH